jgi:hypothetical protein
MNSLSLLNRKEALLREVTILNLSEDGNHVLKGKGILKIADLVKVDNNNSLWERLARVDIAIIERFLRKFGLHRWMSENEVNALLF